MSTAELQNQVIKRIVNIKDDYVLEDILNRLDIAYSDEIVKLSNDEKDIIETGLTQIKNGESFTNEEVELEMQQILNNG